MDHYLFCRVKLIRGNNKHNSLTMRPSIYIMSTWLCCVTVVVGSLPRVCRAEPKVPGNRSAFLLSSKDSVVIISVVWTDECPSSCRYPLPSVPCLEGKASWRGVFLIFQHPPWGFNDSHVFCYCCLNCINRDCHWAKNHRLVFRVSRVAWGQLSLLNQTGGNLNG